MLGKLFTRLRITLFRQKRKKEKATIIFFYYFFEKIQSYLPKVNIIISVELDSTCLRICTE